MCFDFGIGETIALTAAMSAASAAVAAKSASDQNKAIKKSREAAAKAAGVETAQAGVASQFEMDKNARDAARVRGILRVQAAERGVDFDGSEAALEDNAVQAQRINDNVTQTNLAYRNMRTRSELNATDVGLANRRQDAYMALFNGGLSGAQTGLSISGGLNNLGKMK